MAFEHIITLFKLPKTSWSVWFIAKDNLHWCFVHSLACLKKKQFFPTERAISLSSNYFSELIQSLHNTKEMASWITFVPLIQEHSYCFAQNPKIPWATFMISVRTFFKIKLAINILLIFNYISYFIPNLHYLSLFYVRCKWPIMTHCIYKYKVCQN